MAAHIAMYYKYSGNTEFRDQSVKLIKAMANFRRPSIKTSSPNYYRSMERIGLLAWRSITRPTVFMPTIFPMAARCRGWRE